MCQGPLAGWRGAARSQCGKRMLGSRIKASRTVASRAPHEAVMRNRYSHLEETWGTPRPARASALARTPRVHAGAEAGTDPGGSSRHLCMQGGQGRSARHHGGAARGRSNPFVRHVRTTVQTTGTSARNRPRRQEGGRVREVREPWSLSQSCADPLDRLNNAPSHSIAANCVGKVDCTHSHPRAAHEAARRKWATCQLGKRVADGQRFVTVPCISCSAGGTSVPAPALGSCRVAGPGAPGQFAAPFAANVATLHQTFSLGFHTDSILFDCA